MHENKHACIDEAKHEWIAQCICIYISGVSTPGSDGGDSGDTNSGLLQEKEKCVRATAELRWQRDSEGIQHAGTGAREDRVVVGKSTDWSLPLSE